jgi:hypothetical protein
MINTKPSQAALEKSAHAWCSPTTSDIEMDIRLATEFANTLDEYIEENTRLRSLLQSIYDCGHNDDCIFCGLKDKIVVDSLEENV